jgi:hypothetical protein
MKVSYEPSGMDIFEINEEILMLRSRMHLHNRLKYRKHHPTVSYEFINWPTGAAPTSLKIHCHLDNGSVVLNFDERLDHRTNHI